MLSIGLTILTPNFFSVANLTNVTLQIAVLVIVALGMTLVILTEGIDLSLGPVLGLCGVVMGMMVVTGWPLWMAIGAAVLIGAAFGVVNGTLISYVDLPPFVVTLATFGIARSLATMLTEGNSVTGLPVTCAGSTTAPLGIPCRCELAPCSVRRDLPASLPDQIRPLHLRHRRQPARAGAVGGNARFYQVLVYVYAGVLTAFFPSS